VGSYFWMNQKRKWNTQKSKSHWVCTEFKETRTHSVFDKMKTSTKRTLFSEVTIGKAKQTLKTAKMWVQLCCEITWKYQDCQNRKIKKYWFPEKRDEWLKPYYLSIYSRKKNHKFYLTFGTAISLWEDNFFSLCVCRVAATWRKAS